MVAIIVYFLMHVGEKYFGEMIAPALILICYGLVIIINGSLGSVHEWVFFLQAGSLRAIGGLCLGGFCCYIVNSIPQHSLTKIGDIVVSFFQLGLMAFSIFLMSCSHGYTDVVQVVIFSSIIIISFTEDTMLNRFCNAEICFILGKFSMIVFVTQHVAYCSPTLLFYPDNWICRYIMYVVYVMLFSLLNYLIVENIQRRHILPNIKQLLWKMDK